jgi:hypothetical protein
MSSGHSENFTTEIFLSTLLIGFFFINYHAGLKKRKECFPYNPNTFVQTDLIYFANYTLLNKYTTET